MSLSRKQVVDPKHYLASTHILLLVTAQHCESVKHLLQLNSDSTFILKVFCYGDTASQFQSTIKQGLLKRVQDSVFKFQCTDNSVFQVAKINDTTIQIISKNGEGQFNYPFQKELSNPN